MCVKYVIYKLNGYLLVLTGDESVLSAPLNVLAPGLPVRRSLMADRSIGPGIEGPGGGCCFCGAGLGAGGSLGSFFTANPIGGGGGGGGGAPPPPTGGGGGGPTPPIVAGGGGGGGAIPPIGGGGGGAGPPIGGGGGGAGAPNGGGGGGGIPALIVWGGAGTEGGGGGGGGGISSTPNKALSS